MASRRKKSGFGCFTVLVLLMVSVYMGMQIGRHEQKLSNTINDNVEKLTP